MTSDMANTMASVEPIPTEGHEPTPMARAPSVFAELGTAAVQGMKLIVSALVKHFELKDTGVKVKKSLVSRRQTL
jgi:hypothetical protein